MGQQSDDLFMGTAFIGGPFTSPTGNPSRMTKGFGPMGRVYAFDIVPAAAAANNIALAQAIAGAADALINGALAVAGVATMDFDRCVQLVSSNAGDTTQVVTVFGTDRYGQLLSQTVTLNGTAIVKTTKAYKTITRIAVSAVMVGNLTAGTNDDFGSPVLITDRGYFARVGWNNTLAENAATVVLGDATNPATLVTTDVRGLITPSSASDGVKRLVVLFILTAIQVGPNATRLGLAGVNQNLSP